MDWIKYDQIQADLGGIGDSFSMDYIKLINCSNIDTNSKDLILEICNSIKIHFEETAILISKVARLMTS